MVIVSGITKQETTYPYNS